MIPTWLYTFSHEFVHLITAVTPYFIIGVAFGAALETYIKTDYVLKFLNKGTRSIINASILGVILPGCACATIPMAESMRAKGSRIGTLTAFIMASPLLAPQTLILTYGLLGWKFAAARFLAALCGAISLGMVTQYFERKKVAGFQGAAGYMPDSTCCHSDHRPTVAQYMKNVWILAKKLGKYFILGMAIASVFVTLIPKELIPQLIGSSSAGAYMLALIVGIPMYVCEGEEIPVTLSLMELGLGPGPAFTFLLGSVGTCIPTIIMARKIIGNRPTALYVGGWFIVALVSGLVFSFVYHF